MADGLNVLGCVTGKDYALYNGDSAEVLTQIPSESIHYSIFSPPFQSLYTYSNSERDLGNCETAEEFYEQFSYIGRELYRIIMPGRLMSVHCMNLPTSKERDGYIGIRDFRGELIRFFQEIGFIYHSEVVIWKDPVTAMQRTKALGLLHKQLKKDSCMSRQGIPDYLVTFRKPGDNPERVTHTNESFPVSLWQRYASPVWMDINPSNTLQRESAREEQDERHICLAEGTLVLTKRGYIPIETVVPGEDETLTHNGRWMKIVAKAQTRKGADVVQTIAHGVPKLITTPDHKLMAKKCVAGKNRKQSIESTDAEWVKAQDCGGHYLLSNLPPVMDSDISADEWWVIGRWLADGHVDVRGHQFIVSIGNDKLPEFENKSAWFCGHRHTNGRVTQIGLINLSDAARNFLRKCGEGAANKVLPVEGVSLNKELSEELLSGYLSGDGHFVQSKGSFQVTSVSRALLLGMAIVAHRARNVCPSVYAGRPERESAIEGRKVHCKQEWQMAFGNAYSFARIEQFSEWKPVKQIKEAGNADVWSIEVDGDHSFTVEGCIVKNCPLQLEVIERAIDLWTNPGDVVLTPFLGIGSEAYVALQKGRKAIGVELKESYFKQAVANCKSVAETAQVSVEDLLNG